MYNIAGFILSIIFIRMALDHLAVDSEFYLDEVAILIVFGGTLGTLIVSFPPIFLKKFLMAPITILTAKKPNFSKSAVQLLEATKNEARRKLELKKLIQKKDIDPFLKEGIELYLLDLPQNEFKDIMTERIYRSRQRDEDNVNLFRRLSKYPPAFGLVGTVFGLVALMRSVGEGADAAQIGLNMALALVATLYGLATANFLLAPIAEFFQNHADESKVYKELILEGLLMCYQEAQSLTIQEMLNSYLDPKQRVDVIGINVAEVS